MQEMRQQNGSNNFENFEFRVTHAGFLGYTSQGSTIVAYDTVRGIPGNKPSRFNFPCWPVISGEPMPSVYASRPYACTMGLRVL